MAKDACEAQVAKLRGELAQTHRELADIEKGMAQLEDQRAQTIERIRVQAEVDGANTPGEKASAATSKADALRGKIAELQKRSQFIVEQLGSRQASPSLDEEIEDVTGKRRIDIEIEAMKRARRGSGSEGSSGDS